jgi:hypothetical protein
LARSRWKFGQDEACKSKYAKIAVFEAVRTHLLKRRSDRNRGERSSSVKIGGRLHRAPLFALCLAPPLHFRRHKFVPTPQMAADVSAAHHDQVTIADGSSHEEPVISISQSVTMCYTRYLWSRAICVAELVQCHRTLPPFQKSPLLTLPYRTVSGKTMPYLQVVGIIQRSWRARPACGSSQFMSRRPRCDECRCSPCCLVAVLLSASRRHEMPKLR